MSYSNIENEKIKIISWASAREMVKQVNIPLFSEIDAMDYPDNLPPLVLCTYEYGDMITKNGELQLPVGLGNKLLPVSHPEVPKPFKKMLGYSCIPLFLLLNKSSEAFIYREKNPVPLNFFEPGSLLGLFESMDFMFHVPSQPSWCVSAGARSIFMLPKISETQGFMRLSKAYGLPMTLQPKTSFDHWQLFVELAKKITNTQNSWKSQVILFPEAWLKIQNPRSLSPFQLFLIKDTWKNAHDALGKIRASLFWQNLVETISSRNLKPKAHLLEHVRHIMGIAQGQFPGFRPVEQNENAAPSELIQNAFIDTYRLENFFPSLLHIFPVRTIQKFPVYYSLSHPSLLEGIGFSKDSKTIISELREIILIMDTQKSRFTASSFDTISPHDFIFEYFHTQGSINDRVRPIEEIFKKDLAFLKGRSKTNLHLCTTSNFFNGCIQIQNCEDLDSE